MPPSNERTTVRMAHVVALRTEDRKGHDVQSHEILATIRPDLVSFLALDLLRYDAYGQSVCMRRATQDDIETFEAWVQALRDEGSTSDDIRLRLLDMSEAEGEA